MAQNTNLNIAPYYDDFDKFKNFHKVLFRPGYPIQARELTTMQSILQNQIENVGAHLFKDGAMVIPGQVGYDLNVNAVLLQSAFLGANVEDYREQLTGTIISGLNSNVKAKVLYSISETESERDYITLYVKYIESGGETLEQTSFSNNEQLICDNEITFGSTLIEVGTPFAQLLPSDSLAIGSAAYIQEGVYFIRGYFVDVQSDYILLDQYTNNPSYRVGLEVSESIVTPEDDNSLNDNAAGTSNYSAPGAHRFKIKCSLVKKTIDDDSDKNFIELLRLVGSKVQQYVDTTAYSELEKTLASRTYDESGDYVVDDFDVYIRECLNDGFNAGIYTEGQTTAFGNNPSDDLMCVEISPGKAYVRGYQIKTLQPTYVDVAKPREYASIQNGIVPFELGVYFDILNVYGQPNITGPGLTNHFQILELRDQTATPGTAGAGNIIGYARAVQMKHEPSSADGPALYLMDSTMFTVVTLNQNCTISAGSIVRGKSSRAKAFVVDPVTNDNKVLLYQSTGSFIPAEILTVDGRDKGQLVGLHTYELTDTKYVVGRTEGGVVRFTADLVLNNLQTIDGNSFKITDNGNGTKTLKGFNTQFEKDVRPGDVFTVDGTNTFTVAQVDHDDVDIPSIVDPFDQTAIVFIDPGSTVADGDYTTLIRLRPFLYLKNYQNGDLSIDMPKESIRSITDESTIVYRTYDNVTVANGSFTQTLLENEQFESAEYENYTITVLASTNGSFPVGSEINIGTLFQAGNVTFNTSGLPRQTITVSGLTNISSIKLVAAISKNVVTKKIKNATKMHVLKVNKTSNTNDEVPYNLAYSNLYGTRIEDEEISLGKIDCYKLHAVFESYDDDDAVIPNMTLVDSVFFAPGSIVIGRTSGARARVVSFSPAQLKLHFVYLVDNVPFILGEVITGKDLNGAVVTGLINDTEGSINAGSKNITSQYRIDFNQNGYFYDISKILRTSTSSPLRKLKVVFDYFSHESGGDYFNAQSYVGIDYKEIPYFKPQGSVQLIRDAIDFRPGVKNIADGDGTVANPSFVNCSSLDFKSRLFQTGGLVNATIFDIMKVNEDFRCDYSFYLPRVDKLFLTHDKKFQVLTGKSAENPVPPEDLDNAMLIAIMSHNPYMYDVQKDTFFFRQDNRRYTMRDIGSIDKRLSNVEYYTALSLLESQTQNMKITDADGFDRLKNGYLVDDFSSHNLSDVFNDDYKCSLDFNNGYLRPSHYTTNIPLEYDADSSSNIRRAGDCLLLPYTDLKVIEQPYASRVMNVNPFNVFTYIGRIDLRPSSDDWIDVTRLPARNVNVEGDYSAVAKDLNVDQNGYAPIQWGAWQTTWAGETLTSSSQYLAATDLGGGRRLGSLGHGANRNVRYLHERREYKVVNNQARQGVRTKVVPIIEKKSLGDKIIQQTIIPYIRSRNVSFQVDRMKPKTKFYCFFDGQSIDKYLTPKLIEITKNSAQDPRSNDIPFVIGETVTGLTSGAKLKVVAPNDKYKYNVYASTTVELPSAYSSQTSILNIDTDVMANQVNGDFYGNIQVGEVLVGQSGARAVVKDKRILSDNKGSCFGTFYIPNPSIDANPRWATGTRVMRFTTSATNSFREGEVESSADGNYEARGVLNTVEETILHVRNAQLVKDTVSEERSVVSTRTETRQIGWYDPLAQSFLVVDEGGIFLTKVEVYFFSKDNSIPVSCQIRSMQNGYPTPKILPFSDVTVYPDDVQLSENASIPTTFTFKTPVYLQQSIEYAFILLSDSNEYRVWISRMGDIDVTGDRTISEQPYAGVLFKSQNASTWTADQYEDLKFTMYRANFTATSGSATFFNAGLAPGNNQIPILKENPITTFKPSQTFTLNDNGYTFTQGAKLIQKLSNAEATVESFNDAVTPNQVTVNNIVGTFEVGTDDGSGNLTYQLVSSQSLAAFTLNSGYTGTPTVGKTLTGDTSGATGIITSFNSTTRVVQLNFISGTFEAGESVVQVSPAAQGTITSASVSHTGDTRDAIITVQPSYPSAARKVRVKHKNHGMHDFKNNVAIAFATSEIFPTFLTADMSDTDLVVNVEDASAFHRYINGQPISSSNPGYIKLLDEIMAYEAISEDGRTITIKEGGRGQNFTTAVEHIAFEEDVECYNLDGIPLTEINKIHTQIANPTLDSYELITTSVANVGIDGGGIGVNATQNIQFETLTPQIQTMTLPGTEIVSRFNGITGTSINDSTTLESSFVNDRRFVTVIPNTMNYLDKPFLIASQLNEAEELNGDKSFRFECQLKTDKSNVSPVIDLDRCSVTLTTNRINNITIESSNSRSISGDLHEAVYMTRLGRLDQASRTLSVMFAATRHPDASFDVFYRAIPFGWSQPESLIGWEWMGTNSNYGGVPITPTENILFKDYEFQVTGLNFTAFAVKIVMRSKNQAHVPLISDFRAIALAT